MQEEDREDRTDAGDLPEQARVRQEKLARRIARGDTGYPVSVPRTSTPAQVRADHDGLPPDTATGVRVSVTGRVVSARSSGRIAFATLREGDDELQALLSVDRVGRDALDTWAADVDLGDLVSVTGEVGTSRRGELSVLVEDWTLAAKALRPFPDKWSGLTDPEARVRQRYVDLVVNPGARRVLLAKAAVVRSLRESLYADSFVEVETPILTPMHGGASARPFITHMNALDIPLYLRIALELYLKRLLVGGVDRVYELGRNFRNEGADATHNPEFTMLEAYWSYSDYDHLAARVRAWVLAAAEAVGSAVVPDGRGGEIDLAAPWREATVHGLVSEALGEPVDPGTPRERLVALAGAARVELVPDWSAGEIVLELYEKLVEHTLIAPTLVKDYPVEVRPLARLHRDDPRLTEALDVVIGGRELAPVYSELNDPADQRRRLLAQAAKAAAGDEEAMVLDEDFLLALEYGMPPAGGMGMGVDRLVMLLTGNTSIRETMTFPLVRRH